MKEPKNSKKTSPDTGFAMPGVDVQQLEMLLDFMAAHGLEEFEYEHGGLHIRLRKASSGAPVQFRGSVLPEMAAPQAPAGDSATPLEVQLEPGEVTDLRPGAVHGVVGCLAELVCAGRIAVLFAQVRQHRIDDGGVDGRRGVVVTVDTHGQSYIVPLTPNRDNKRTRHPFAGSHILTKRSTRYYADSDPGPANSATGRRGSRKDRDHVETR